MGQSLRVTLHLFRILGQHLEPHCFYTLTASIGSRQAHLQHARTLSMEGEVRINQKLEMVCPAPDEGLTQVSFSMHSMKGYHKTLMGQAQIQLSEKSSNTFQKVTLTSPQGKSTFLEMNVHLSRCADLEETLKRSRANSASKLSRTPSHSRVERKPSTGEHSEQSKLTSKATTSEVEICNRNSSPLCGLIIDNLETLDKVEHEANELRPTKASDRHISGSCIIQKVDKVHRKVEELAQKQKLLLDDDAMERFMRLDRSNPNRHKPVHEPRPKVEQRVKYCGMNSRVLSLNFSNKKPVRSKLALAQREVSISSRQFEMSDFEAKFLPFTVDSAALRAFFSRQTLTLQDIDPSENKEDRSPFSGMTEQQERGQEVLYNKLSSLFDQATTNKKKTKMLAEANELLSQNELVLEKKIELSSNIIKQNEQLISDQLVTLKEAYKEVSDKLIQKYKDEVIRENKVKTYLKQIEDHVREINALKKDKRERIKEMQSLKARLGQQFPFEDLPQPIKTTISIEEDKDSKPELELKPSVKKVSIKTPSANVTSTQLEKLELLEINHRPSIEPMTDRPRWRNSRLFRSQMPSREKLDESSEKKSYKKFERKKSQSHLSGDSQPNIVIDLN